MHQLNWQKHLLDEGKEPESIYVTGNTVIDAMQHTVIADYHHPELDWVGESRMILLLPIEGKSWPADAQYVQSDSAGFK